MILQKTPLDDKVVIFGQSCCGKSAMARQMAEHTHYCFDSLFHWHAVEALGLSPSANLRAAAEACKADRYVLDGWHLSDREGKLLPPGSVIYVVYMPRHKILEQYRVPVDGPDSHKGMFEAWYRGVPYGRLPGTRYFLNEGDFTETDRTEFERFLLTSFS